ncbi:MAG TPA: hypothetical protein VGK53_03160 [Propionicimonas sp.]
MNDLEERLRADFQAAAAQVENRIDADEALLVAQGARSSLRLARTVGVAALAVVVGLVGWGAVNAVPVLGGHPDPMGTVSAVPSIPSTSSSSYVPTDPMSATFELGGKINGQVPSYDSVRVSVKADGDRVAVTVGLLTAVGKTDETLVLRHFAMRAGKLWWVALDEHLVLAITPGRPMWFDGEYDATRGAVTDRQPLTGIDATAFLVGFIKAGGPDTVRGFIWRGADGMVVDSLGNNVPNAEITLDDNSYLIYRDAELDVVGIVPRQGDGGYNVRMRDSSPGDLLGGGMGRQGEDGIWTWTTLGVLPAGSHDIKVNLAPGDGSWASGVMSDGSVAVLASNHAKSEHGKVVTSFSYTDANGKRVSYPK